MNEQYCLFGVDTRRVLELGEKTSTGCGFQGPTIHRLGKRYRLPEDLLAKLLQRFTDENPVQGTVLAEKERLFSGAFKSSADEIFAIVGRDADDDPPYEHYLPELRQPQTVQRLIPL
jgi:hypothetical protein